MSKSKPQQLDYIATKRASEFGTSEPKFMWFPFLPCKKLVLLQGESGIGKSSLILNIATLLSHGKPMPFESESNSCECADTLYFCKEDDAEETINPRLIAMGADRDRIHILTEPYFLENDCKRVKNTILKHNVRLFVIDPLTSFIKNHNMNTAQSVGNLMRELSQVAFTTDCTIVAVCHLTKNANGKEIDRHLGSSDIVNAARSVLSVTQEDENSDIMTVKHLKSSLAKRAKPFYYEIIGNGVIEFKSGEEADTDEFIPSSKKDIAKNMLVDMLSNGAMPQPEIKAKFEKIGVCGWRTVETAKSELNLDQFYGDDGVSYWRLG